MYTDFGKLFDIPNFAIGASVVQPDWNGDSGELQDFLTFYVSSNSPADNVDIELKLRNTEGVETDWFNWTGLPGTNGLINSTMIGQYVGYSFKLKATNNSANIITNFKLWLQGKSM